MGSRAKGFDIHDATLYIVVCVQVIGQFKVLDDAKLSKPDLFRVPRVSLSVAKISVHN